jgi:hypothetical protein
MQHYYAIAEPDDAGGFWISFPDGPGIFSAANSAGEIVAQARDALDTALLYPPGAHLPHAIEDGAMPPNAAVLADFEGPLIVVIPFEPRTEAKAAA